jgi:hypothetical protein
VGALIAALANNALSKYDNQSGWIIATALQVLPPFLILLGLPFTPGEKNLFHYSRVYLTRHQTRLDGSFPKIELKKLSKF